MKINFIRWNNLIAYGCLSIVVIVLTFFVVYKANWLFGDQAEWLRTTAISKIEEFSHHIIPAEGRFCPLCHFSYNILIYIPFGYTATAHYILNAVSFIIFVIAFIFLLNKIVIVGHNSILNIWIVVCTMLFLIQRIYPVFLDVIFPERIVVTLLAVFMFFTWKFYKTNKWNYGIIALLCAVYMVYCKEPLFGALLVFAITNLVLNWKNLSSNNRIFQWILVVNSLIFVILYYFFVYRGIVSPYTGNHGENNWINMSLRMIWGQKIVILAIILFFFRIYAIFFIKIRDSLFYDGLLFAGLAYFGACLVLKLNYTYYYLPAVILITPSIVYWLIHYLKPFGAFGLMAFFALFYPVKLPTIIRDNQQKRKDTYPTIEHIANYVPAGYQLVWYEAKSSEKHFWNNELRDWKKSSLQAYLAYILKDEKFKFVTVNSLLESKNHKSLILYPLENDFINNESTNQFAIETQQLTKDTIAQIADITIMKLSK